MINSQVPTPKLPGCTHVPPFGSPGGHGISSETNLPTEWSPAADGQPAVNIKWQTEIPGRGHSSPVIWGNRIFVTTSLKGEHVPGRKAPVHLDFQKKPGYVHPDTLDVDYKHTLKVYAIDAGTGKVVWERTAYDGEMAELVGLSPGRDAPPTRRRSF